ncbi:MAG: dual specificity protein phosphatase family protein [Thaumarchaeota archaeon]|nr:dual specificity protein phosphatase family protein [Nitrososphaerota archaeon]
MMPSCAYWVERGRLAGSCMPRGMDDLRAIRDSGIQRVVVLPEDHEIAEYWGDARSYFEALSAFDLDFLHEPVPDMEAPSVGQLVDIVRWIREGGPALVHCVGGMGRTGTVVAAWLIVERDLPAREALALVRSLKPGSVQSYRQLSFLAEVEDKLEKIRGMLYG